MNTAATATRYILGDDEAAAAVQNIVYASQSFSFEPLPFEWYAITVKAEAVRYLPNVDGKNVLDVPPP